MIYESLSDHMFETSCNTSPQQKNQTFISKAVQTDWSCFRDEVTTADRDSKKQDKHLKDGY